MSTFNQLVRNNRKPKIKYSSTRRGLRGCPQKKGVCHKVYIVKPKKPNSALRKVVKVFLRSSGLTVIASVPGIGHELMKFSTVMIRGGRSPDLPGVRYKLIRGKYDFKDTEDIVRIKSRSKYGKKKVKDF